MPQEQELLHVYFMPGMAANPTIFESIHLPEDQFQIHWLEWLIPEGNESLESYSKRVLEHVYHKNIVLIGVSFGGIIVQEMAKLIKVKQVIIISSVKCSEELPKTMRYAAKTGLYKLLPTSLMNYADQFEKVAVGDYLTKRAKLYKKYLSVRDLNYIDWAIEKMIKWKCEEVLPNIVHIHGNKDEIFPIKNIHDCIVVEGGTHIMVVNRFRWFNEHLPTIILTGKI